MRNYKYNHSRGFRGKKTRSFGDRPRVHAGNRRQSRSNSLNPMMFVKRAVELSDVFYSPENSFSTLCLNEIVKRNILNRGFDKPTAIQDKAIPLILKGNDLVGIADTGTGKTAAFLLPLISKAVKDKSQNVLIIAPTRELAAQIQDEFKLFSQGLGLFSTLCIGGASINAQMQNLFKGSNFVIGTPGRIKDLEKRRALRLAKFQNVVLDEVDRMLDMGFIHDVRHIVSLLSENRQSLFFSATLPKETAVIMQSFLKNPEVVSVKNGPTCQNIDQDIIRVEGRSKIEILHDLLIKEEFKKVLVFGRTKWGISKLEKNLVDRGFRAASIHGNKSQGQRTRALKLLKENQIQVLLATDIASRGIDVNDITHVINYDIPESYDDYTHRIGRTGRAGKKGTALTFVD